MKPSSRSAIVFQMEVAFLIVCVIAMSCLSFAASSSSQDSSSSSSASSSSSDVMESIANAKIQLSPSDLATAGSHYGKSHGKYYMYAEVPKKGAYKMGFKRGNGKHMIERKESVHKSHVESYFKWHDKKGKGSHKFEFKHDDNKKKHY